MKILVPLIAYIFMFFSCKHKEKNETSSEILTKLNMVQNQNEPFKNIKLPLSSANINFKTDSLGYYISNRKDYISSDLLDIDLLVKDSIIPIGKMKFQRYSIYIYGYGKVGEEILQPIIMAKTYDNKNNIIDSLELQRYQSWDYELQKTFVYNEDNNIEIFENTIAYKLNNINEEGVKTSKRHKYFLNENGNFINLYNKKTSKKSEYNGSFSINVETELTENGLGSINYLFRIDGETAILNTDTFHEPIRCNGLYKIKSNENFIELYYADVEKSKCSLDKPNYIIKKVNGQFFITGVGGEATINEWLILKKNI